MQKLQGPTRGYTMTIDINKRMMEKHSEALQQNEADRAIVRARKEVEINGHRTSGYCIKEGEHAGTVLGHIQRSIPKI